MLFFYAPGRSSRNLVLAEMQAVNRGFPVEKVSRAIAHVFTTAAPIASPRKITKRTEQSKLKSSTGFYVALTLVYTQIILPSRTIQQVKYTNTDVGGAPTELNILHTQYRDAHIPSERERTNARKKKKERENRSIWRHSIF